MNLLTIAWVVIGVAVIGLVAMVLAAARRPSFQDLGSVSSQWIAEKRAGQPDGAARPRQRAAA